MATKDYEKGPICSPDEFKDRARQHLRCAKALFASENWADARQHAHAAIEHRLKAGFAPARSVPKVHDLRELYAQLDAGTGALSAVEKPIERLARDYPTNVGALGCETHVECGYNPERSYYTRGLAEESITDAQGVMCFFGVSQHELDEDWDDAQACWERCAKTY